MVTGEAKGATRLDIKSQIEAANQVAVEKMMAAEPVLVDLVPAGDVIPGLTDYMILHSGPPVRWETMSGAQRGAAIANALFEGWAQTPEHAEELLASGEVRFDSNHHHQAVGPMAGTISKSMWVFVVENREAGNRSYCRQVEDRQQFGEYTEGAIDLLHRWSEGWAPTLREALQVRSPLPIKPMIARALQMGDELHNRQVAASSLFANTMAVPLLDAQISSSARRETLEYLVNHDVFFLGLSMAAGKAAADAARGIEYSTMVTAMARNGTEFGIQVSGLDGQWFTATSPEVDGLFLPGYSEADAGLDIGDSAITETIGLGGFVLGGAPGILSLVGGTPEEALEYSREMEEITLARSPDFRMPVFGFQGSPVGIDIRKVVDRGVLPIIDTAMAHKEPGHPIIGAGLVRPPMECFTKALKAFSETYL